MLKSAMATKIATAGSRVAAKMQQTIIPQIASSINQVKGCKGETQEAMISKKIEMIT